MSQAVDTSRSTVHVLHHNICFNSAQRSSWKTQWSDTLLHTLMDILTSFVLRFSHIPQTIKRPNGPPSLISHSILFMCVLLSTSITILLLSLLVQTDWARREQLTEQKRAVCRWNVHCVPGPRGTVLQHCTLSQL